MPTKNTMTKTPTPHVTDEQIDIISNSPFPRVSDALKHLRDIYEADLAKREQEVKDLHPATPEEIAAHEVAIKDQARKEKISKLVFGARVAFCGDNRWRVCADMRTPGGMYIISKSGTSQTDLAKADELTIID